MSKYKVINNFQEKNHGGHVYKKDDPYPAPGKKLIKARAEFLTKTHAEYGVAFLEEIKEVEEKKELEKPSTVGKDEESDE